MAKIMAVPVVQTESFENVKDGDELSDDQLAELWIEKEAETTYVAQIIPAPPPHLTGGQPYLVAPPPPFRNHLPLDGLRGSLPPGSFPQATPLFEAPEAGAIPELEDPSGSTSTFHTEGADTKLGLDEVVSADGMAVECRNAFNALVRQGFTPAQALELIREVVRAWASR